MMGQSGKHYNLQCNLKAYYPERFSRHHSLQTEAIWVLSVSWLLATLWLPLGGSVSLFGNFMFILLHIGLVLGGFSLFIGAYPRILRWCLANKGTFLLIPAYMVLLGLNAWLGFNGMFR